MTYKKIPDDSNKRFKNEKIGKTGTTEKNRTTRNDKSRKNRRRGLGSNEEGRKCDFIPRTSNEEPNKKYEQ